MLAVYLYDRVTRELLPRKKKFPLSMHARHSMNEQLSLFNNE